MRRIAREVGISATAIYLYFANKDAIFEALVDEGMERLFETLSAIRSEGGPPMDVFERMCRGYIEFGLQNPEYYEIMFVLRSEAMSRFPADKYRRARRNLGLMGEVIEAATGSSSDSALIRATSVWASLHGVVSLIIAGRVDARINQHAVVDHTVARLCADVLQKRIEAPPADSVGIRSDPDIQSIQL